MYKYNKNLIGKRFGSLVVKYPTRRFGAKKQYYRYKCDCGGDGYLYEDQLYYNKIKSCRNCGINNLKGKWIGEFKVINAVGRDKNKRLVHKLMCNKGHIKYAVLYMLKNNIKCEECKINSEVGKVYGSITVVSYDYESKNKNVYKLKCGCGRSFKANINKLKRGVIKSCGCSKMKPIKDNNGNIKYIASRIKVKKYKPYIPFSVYYMYGKTYNSLKVIKFHSKDNQGTPVLYCKCDCGNTTLVRSSHLKGDIVKSCGSCRLRNEIGRKYNRLTVHSFSHINKNNKYVFNFICECGNKKQYILASVINGHIKSCGCLSIEVNKKHNEHQKAKSIEKFKCGLLYNNRHKLRHNTLMYEFIKKVKERHYNTCKKCGSNKNIQVHHMLPFNSWPKYAVNASNGVCLCDECHINFHRIYGKYQSGSDNIDFLYKKKPK